MYNYAFYAYLFYRGIKVTSSIGDALGFVSFVKSIYRWVRVLSIKDEEPDIGWVLIYPERVDYPSMIEGSMKGAYRFETV